MALALPAQAETYRVDLILFLDKHATGEAGRAPAPMDTARAIDTGNAAALAAAGIALVPDEQFALAEQWNRLRNSKRWQPLAKLAWTQKDPPAERGPALRVKIGQALAIDDPARGSSFGVAPIEGSVALLLRQYLNVDADLQYTLPSGGGFSSYRLKERRRMRRDELHHLDSPKLGIIAKVSKAS